MSKTFEQLVVDLNAIPVDPTTQNAREDIVEQIAEYGIFMAHDSGGNWYWTNHSAENLGPVDLPGSRRAQSHR